MTRWRSVSENSFDISVLFLHPVSESEPVVSVLSHVLAQVPSDVPGRAGADLNKAQKQNMAFHYLSYHMLTILDCHMEPSD